MKFNWKQGLIWGFLILPALTESAPINTEIADDQIEEDSILPLNATQEISLSVKRKQGK